MAEAAERETKRSEMLTLCLPSLSEDDPLFSQKKDLVHGSDLTFKFQVPVPSNREEVFHIFEQIVRSARILYLDEVELYFMEDDDYGPFSCRNELESLNTILLMISSLISCAKPDGLEVLQILQNATVAMINSVGAKYTDYMVAKDFPVDAKELLKWGDSCGIRTKLKIAYFEEAGRGAVASEDIKIGDIALEVPESLIISEEHVRESDMFDVLKELDDVSSETMLLLWSMKERRNSNSKFKIYFKTLPEKFKTGLTFGIDALAALEGTLLFEELLQAKEHLRQQYDALCPTLFAKYPKIFPPELYTWDCYLWACELWYSNGMKIVCSDGKLRTCLVPVAGLLNHSLCPHVLRYGRVNSETKSLKFLVSRHCGEGEQCYLSYGSLPGSHLITFYGFLPKGDNPYDVIPLDFDVPSAENDSSCQSGEPARTSHMVRGTWLSKSSKPHTYGLSPPLLAHLRSILRSSDIELHAEFHGQDEETERAVLDTLISVFSPMLEGLGDTNEIDRENPSWDVKLALDYKDLLRRIICSVLDSCAAGIRELDLSLVQH
ncbi:uncharacterized protein A4U43_C05F34730 [Asparagus officinalis]|uniref:SET domain-containing protein n=1 Tax=Asparagus officinalis TaxID=4686 RepID=A0A5P1EWW4_ASPOF|nr:uncharacterized protein LOC109841323 [Asparagus officinalis]XP_020265845.1 uncharacterized protein LOC109841323 [Asparagus officinalis]XP_020265846.1 uncharacterized protein LOC109841323 [Asparagus officinalis]ONK70536.1 uncharacterized protein A4U43_C05F34730 [Asparagus officinalis]